MSNRQLTLTIDLAGEQILLERVEAIEALSRPFLITVDLFSSLGEIDLYPHLGKPAVISVHEDDEFMRSFHGIVVEGEYLAERAEGYHYRLILRPWTYLLSHNRDFAIFQNKTMIDIVKQVLAPYGFAKVDYGKVSGAPRQRDYCVQYGESDFAFIARLLEEDGYYFYFEHGEDGHTLVLCDSPQSHAAGLVPTLTYNPSAAAVGNSGSSARAGVKRYLSHWNERVATGGENKVTMRDFDFEKPQRPVETMSSAPGIHPLDALEVYEWPGRYTKPTDGTRSSQVMLDSRRARRQTYSGEVQVAALGCGQKVSIVEHPLDRLNRGYVITRTHHLLSAETHRSASSTAPHSVHFEAIPDDIVWRTAQSTPRPVVRGPETAIVTGPEGEEIFTDEYGRVKVRFHWDRGDTPGEKSTCWIRVSQTGGLGNIILPRVGHEVIVDFLDGDPDRPIVVGRVFNKSHMPVYPLPANKTRALWRTKRYGQTGSYGAAEALDTGAPGANELRFEDKGGKEEVFLHAERDLNSRVRHKETHHVGLDQGIKIGGSRKVEIKETDTKKVGKSITVTAGTTISMEAKTSITLKVGQTTIVLDPTSVTIKTTRLAVEAKATADVKSPMTTVKGDGVLTLKGGVTLIN